VDCCVSGGESAGKLHTVRPAIDEEAGCWTNGRILVSEAHLPFQQQSLGYYASLDCQFARENNKIGMSLTGVAWHA
jgi:hypothetical protein